MVSLLLINDRADVGGSAADPEARFASSSNCEKLQIKQPQNWGFPEERGGSETH